MFQIDLKEALEKDAAYTAKPSLQGLLTATQLVMSSWEKDAFRQQERAELCADTKRKGSSTSTIPTKRTRADAPSIPDKATVGEHCQGCGRPRHTRDECRSREIPGWNSEGRWIDSKAYKAADAINIANGNGSRHPVLLRQQPAAASQPRDSSKQDTKYGPAGKNTKFKTTRFSDQDDKHRRGNRGPGGNILPAYSLLHITCNCDDTDVDTMYRTCCITTGNSPTSLSVTTLFDTGANPTSFVNRQVAAWIESQLSPQAHGKRKHSPAPSAAVSLAGTSQSSPIYGSVVFNLTFFNEVTRSNETLYRLHANFIDSCIDIIVGRPVIREHHLIQKIPHYFDETTSSKPDLSQSVTPVTPSLAKLSRVCAQPCTTCTPFVLQGYDNTLCSLTMKRPDVACRNDQAAR